MTTADSPLLEVPREVLACLLAQAGMAGDSQVEAILGGMNNRVFRVTSAQGEALLKAYFHHPEDPRDRLATEYGFCAFAWSHGVRALPQPLAADPLHHLAVYEFVHGRRLEPGEVTADHVAQALAFYRDLNRRREQAHDLPTASEACFCLADHLATVQRRVDRLAAIPVAECVDAEAADFLRGELLPAWEEVADEVRSQAATQGLALDRPVSDGDRCLSPSDFGFHNTLQESDGRLRFLDFEYAGWDDPAKLVCDFFHQPAVPVPAEHYESFVQGIIETLADPAYHRARFMLLMPVYRLKWCCILLNDFLPAGGARRDFARGSAEDSQALAQRRARQLAKARQMLQRSL